MSVPTTPPCGNTTEAYELLEESDNHDDPRFDAILDGFRNLVEAVEGVMNPKMSKTKAFMSVPTSSLRHIDSAAQLFGLDYLLGRSDCIWEAPNDSVLGRLRSAEYWVKSSAESLCRTLIDLVLFDIVGMHRHEPAARSIQVMGEYRLTAETPGPQQVLGVADYVLGYRPAVYTVPPVYESFSVVVEAKKVPISLGLGQAVAYMVAAQQHRMNLNPQRIVNVVYGMISDGIMWQFLRLDGKKPLISDCFNTLFDSSRN
ncbi:hypothetical protein McanCB21832_002105 [Microsporum canis]